MSNFRIAGNGPLVGEGKRKKSTRLLIVTLLLGFALVVSGCFLERSPLLPDPDIEVHPTLVCAGEAVHVSWTVPNFTTGCPRRISAGEAPCASIVSLDANGASLGISSTEYPGSRDVVVTSDTTFSISTHQYTDSSHFFNGIDSASVSVIEGAGEHIINFGGTCGPYGSVGLSDFSACLEIGQVCLLTRDPVELIGNSRAGGDTRITAQYQLGGANPRCTDGSSLNSVDFLTVRNLSFVPPPGGSSTDCTTVLPTISISFGLTCAADLGSCSATGMGGGGEGEPAPGSDSQPTPTGTSSQPNSSGTATDEPEATEPCADNGGLQFQGEVCVCSGVVDQVTICNDGTKTDALTSTACSPDPSQCSQGDGSTSGGGGQTSCEKSCGNQSCQAECGENPNNCPADCP